MNPKIRAKLFEIATAEFTEHGFALASLNRIIGSISMSKSSFYHFFANKTELFQQIMEQTLEPIQSIAQAYDFDALTKENFWPNLMQTSQHAVLLAGKLPHIMAVGRMFHKNRGGADNICAILMDGPISMVNQLLERGQEVGAIRKDIPPTLLLNMVMALGMEIDRWALDNIDDFASEEAKKFNRIAVDVFMKLLKPESEANGPESEANGIV